MNSSQNSSVPPSFQANSSQPNSSNSRNSSYPLSQARSSRSSARNHTEWQWLNEQFMPNNKIEEIQISSGQSVQILNQSDESSEHLYHKRSKRIDAKARAKAIHLFKLDKGTISNEYIAKQIGFSTQRVYQLRKEYFTTGKIRLTIKNKHTPYYENRFNLQNRIMKKFIQNNRYASLRDVQFDLREGGYWMSSTNIQFRMAQLGLYYTPLPQIQDNCYCNSPQILSARYKYASWLQNKMNQQLYYSAYITLNMYEILTIGWHRKKDIEKMKEQIKQNDTFHICLTVGIQGPVGWSVRRKGNFEGVFIKHLIDNFDSIHNRNDYLIINTPKSYIVEKQFFDFISCSSIPYSRVIAIPLQSPFLNPAHVIIEQIKKKIVYDIDKRPMKKYALDGEKEMDKMGEKIQYLIQNSYGPQRMLQIFNEIKRLMLKCLNKQCF